MDQETRTQEIEKRIDPLVSRAIALNGSGAGTFSIAPTNMGDLLEFAKLMSISGPCVRPMFRGNPGACLAVALQAFRNGADPFAAANKAFQVNDQIAYESQYIHAVLNNSRALRKRLRATYSGEAGDRRCKITGYVEGEDEPFEYESPPIARIKKASPLWVDDPDQQLFYFSSRAWGRRYLPEVLLGMYTPDEIRGEIVDLTPAPPAPKREEFEEELIESLKEEPDETAAREVLKEQVLDELEKLWDKEEEVVYREALADDTEQHDDPEMLEKFQEALSRDEAYDRPPMNSGAPSRLVRTKIDDPPPKKSLLVPLRAGSRQGTTDWAGTAQDMIALIDTLTNPDDTRLGGRFEHDNRVGMDQMSRSPDKRSWTAVKYRLTDRTEDLKKAKIA